MNRLSLLSFFAFLLICVQPVLAAISVTVNGQSSNAVIVQGDSLQWTISGLPVGATVSNEIWIDLNANGVLDRSTDILLFSFSQTDGVNGATGGNGNPGDMDGSANGVISLEQRSDQIRSRRLLLKRLYRHPPIRSADRFKN